MHKLVKAIRLLQDASVVISNELDGQGNVIYDAVPTYDANGYAITVTRVPLFEADGLTPQKDGNGDDIILGGSAVTEEVARTVKSWAVSDANVLAQLIEPVNQMLPVSFIDFAEAALARGVPTATLRDIADRPDYLARIEALMLVGDFKSLLTWFKVIPTSISGTAADLTKLKNTTAEFRLRRIDVTLREVYREAITLADVTNARAELLAEL